MVFIGNISSGKTTLAKRYATITNAVRLSSDTIRERLRVMRYPSDGASVFRTMQRELKESVEHYNFNVVVDTTGMSPRFPGVLHNARLIAPVTVVRLTCCENTWRTREPMRDDREPLKRDAYIRSKVAASDYTADYIIHTDTLDADATLARLLEIDGNSRGH